MNHGVTTAVEIVWLCEMEKDCLQAEHDLNNIIDFSN